MIEFKKLTDNELKSIAVDFCEGKIYSDRHIPPEGSDCAIMMVFMPLALGAGKEWSKEDCEQIGMIYEYVSEAGPRSIDSMPSFFSFRMLSKEQMTKFIGFCEDYKRMKDGFLNTENNGANDQQE